MASVSETAKLPNDYYGETIGTSLPYNTTPAYPYGAGYTCPNCSMWVQNGYTHSCYYTTPGYTPPTPDNSAMILNQLYNIAVTLGELQKRLEKIEEILDEEL